jgi:hypothetical protein
MTIHNGASIESRGPGLFLRRASGYFTCVGMLFQVGERVA